MNLSIRVLRFVDHSLSRHKARPPRVLERKPTQAAPLDTSLLSQNLVNE